MTEVIVMVVGNSGGGTTPHDGRYVVHWDPHTEYGILKLTSSVQRGLARRFASAEQVLKEWRTISKHHPVRPDGKPNRPLSGITISVEPL